MGRDRISRGYYVRLLYVGFWGNAVYLEGRVLRVNEKGFLILFKDDVCEFVRWEDVLAYRLGKYRRVGSL